MALKQLKTIAILSVVAIFSYVFIYGKLNRLKEQEKILLELKKQLRLVPVSVEQSLTTVLKLGTQHQDLDDAPGNLTQIQAKQEIPAKTSEESIIQAEKEPVTSQNMKLKGMKTQSVKPQGIIESKPPDSTDSVKPLDATQSRKSLDATLSVKSTAAIETMVLTRSPPTTTREPSNLSSLTQKFQKDLVLLHNFSLPLEDNLTKVMPWPEDLFSEPTTQQLSNGNTTFKKILMWNDAYGQKGFGFGLGREPFLRAGCRVNTCLTTGNRNLVPSAEWDAVIWHFRARDLSLPDKELRSPHTRYVFWMMESAQHLYGNLLPYNGIFNLTFTYRRDSDLPNPYGSVFQRKQPLGINGKDYAANKTKLIAWFVSNCFATSSREQLVRTLKRYVTVDIYGHCGSLVCERARQYDTCLLMVQKDYKFYLSFENSLCGDYVTEKFFDIIRYDVVPVVYGLGNYKKYMPPHSYIDVSDFSNLQALADYLLYLDGNHTAYNEYFLWKDRFFGMEGWGRVARPWCKLCELLHETDNSSQVYQHIYDWFVTDSHCKDSKSMMAFLNT